MTGKRKRSAVRGRRTSGTRPVSTPTLGMPGLGPDGIDTAMEAARRFWDAQNAAWQRDSFGGGA